jgi:hypothetical protein
LPIPKLLWFLAKEINVSDLYLEETISSGQDTGHGNLLGIQPFMLAADYTSHQNLLKKLDGYFDAALSKGWLNEKTIVVLPEYLGTWLVAAGEKPGIYAATNVRTAMRILALSHPFQFSRAYRASKAPDRTAAALFRMKAQVMADGYQFVFSRLAKDYGVTVVAGSILLPEPAVIAGILTPGKGPLHNVSAVFDPDGTIRSQLSRKFYPTRVEQPFVAAAPLAQLPVYETPAGRLGVLVCADSWYPAPYQHLQKQDIELLAVPSLLSNGIWNQPWDGYNGAPPPDDVNRSDVGRLTEGEAWHKYALAGRMALSGARAGMNVFLHGQFWDAGDDSGQSLALGRDRIIETKVAGAALLNFWLQQ